MSKPNNQRAFPSPRMDQAYAQPGMTLRDYFAGQVLSGAFGGTAPNAIDADYMRQHGAKYVYDVADAMLAERDRGE